MAELQESFDTYWAIPVPAGFVRAPWETLAPGEEVWLLGLKKVEGGELEEPMAFGPFRVIKPHLLRDLQGRNVQEISTGRCLRRATLILK